MMQKRAFPRFGLSVVLSLILLVGFACAGMQTEGGKSTVTVTPPTGAKGSDIAITGAGFKSGEEIDIILIMGPGQRVGLGTAKVESIVADKDGTFTAQSNIPSWAQPGVYDIEVEGGNGSMASTKVEVK